jgi:beta-1,4-mannosyltransferase
MNVWMWPKTSDFNVYNNLLTDSLGGEGVNVLDLQHGKLALRVGKAKAGDVVHIHWMHHAYQHRNPLLFIVKSMLFTLTLLYLKLRRVQIVWTVHNLYPHNARHFRLERLMRTLIAGFCSKLIVASESIKRKVAEHFGVPPGKLFVVKHGHYLGVYPPGGIDFRQRYGIREDADVYLFLGAVKAYKGIEDLIEAFYAIRTEQTWLVIAGKPDEQTAAFLNGLEDQSNIVLDLRFVPDGEVADLLGAADAMVMPYKEITTSGSAILGLSFRKLVIMPDNEFIDEYFREDMAIRYNPGEAGALAGAMTKALYVKRSERELEYEEALRELDWGPIAQKVKNVYQGWG